MRRYVELWQVPGSRALLGFGLLARLGFSMTPLGLLLLVQQTTGRYALAALATAVYTLALAIVSPVVGRIVDRVGPSPVLLATAAVHPLLLGLLILAARDAGMGVGVLVAAAATSGATYPPALAVPRGAWAGLTEPGGDRAHLRGPALAADTSLYQGIFVVGPLLVAAIVANWSPSLAIAVSGALTVSGTVGLARGRAVRAWRPQLRSHPADGGGPGPLRASGFPALLVCAAGFGVVFGAVTVAVPAYATAHGSAALAGVLVAAQSTGSMLGGIGYGASRFRASLTSQFGWLLAAIAASYVVLAVLALPAPPAVLALALLLGGGLVAPALTVENALVGRIVPARVRTEAYTWMVCVEVAVAAASIQLAGLLADSPAGLPWVFGYASVAAALTAVLAALPAGPIARAAGATLPAPDADADGFGRHPDWV